LPSGKVTRNPRQPPSEPAAEPGADRFWGQFAQAGNGRKQDAGPGPGPEDRPPEEPGDGSTHHTGAGECLEWCPICRSAEILRSAVSPELREQAENLQAEALKVFQAFLTAYSQKTDREDNTGGSGDPDSQGSAEGREPEVTDIPLD